jgi:tetratricopeptide (TPR) repeat protein
MFKTKIYKILLGFTLLVTVFLPNPAYAESQNETLNTHGNVYYNNRQYDIAIADYNKAIALNTHYAKAYYGKGEALSRLGKNKEAKACLYQFLQYAQGQNI